MLPSGGDMPVDSIAAAAAVSVQTLYAQFGSKRGLLLAVIDTIQRDAGLYADFERVWQSQDGETALRRMLEATFRIWDGAWTFVEFSERARRTDPEIRRHLQEVDGYRLANLRSITDRLVVEGRLRSGLDAAAAADLAFAMSLPAAYEQLVPIRGWTIDRATSAVTDAVVAAIIDPQRPPVVVPPADWSMALRPAAVMVEPGGGGPGVG
jgi:TetR/AcrR family transcriptional regulator of autoinduction and epiphytic fitness